MSSRQSMELQFNTLRDHSDVSLYAEFKGELDAIENPDSRADLLKYSGSRAYLLRYPGSRAYLLKYKGDITTSKIASRVLPLFHRHLDDLKSIVSSPTQLLYDARLTLNWNEFDQADEALPPMHVLQPSGYLECGTLQAGRSRREMQSYRCPIMPNSLLDGQVHFEPGYNCKSHDGIDDFGTSFTIAYVGTEEMDLTRTEFDLHESCPAEKLIRINQNVVQATKDLLSLGLFPEEKALGDHLKPIRGSLLAQVDTIMYSEEHRQAVVDKITYLAKSTNDIGDKVTKLELFAYVSVNKDHELRCTWELSQNSIYFTPVFYESEATKIPLNEYMSVVERPRADQSVTRPAYNIFAPSGMKRPTKKTDMTLAKAVAASTEVGEADGSESADESEEDAMSDDTVKPARLH